MNQAEKSIKEGVEHLRKTIDLFKKANEHYSKGESNGKCDKENEHNVTQALYELSDAYDFVSDIVENDLTNKDGRTNF